MKNSKIILGTVQFGFNYGINNFDGKLSINKVFEIFNYAFKNNIRILDTAEVYGDVHSLIGKYHKNNPSKLFEIITKIPKGFKGNLKKRLDIYLSQLNVKYLNSLFFHSTNDLKNNFMLLKNMIKFKEEKIIKNIGVSVYNDNEINEILNYDAIDIIQMPFNLLDNYKIRENIITKIKAKNIKIHSRSVFLQGLFFIDPSDTNNQIALELSKELSIINKISKESKLSISELALNYCCSNEKIDNILIGVDNLNQLKENLNSIKKNIPHKSINDINKIKVLNKDILNPNTWN